MPGAYRDSVSEHDAPEIVGGVAPRAAAGQRVRRELHVDRHHVRARRRERGVVQRRDA